MLEIYNLWFDELLNKFVTLSPISSISTVSTTLGESSLMELLILPGWKPGTLLMVFWSWKVMQEWTKRYCKLVNSYFNLFSLTINRNEDFNILTWGLHFVFLAASQIVLYTELKALKWTDAKMLIRLGKGRVDQDYCLIYSYNSSENYRNCDNH